MFDWIKSKLQKNKEILDEVQGFSNSGIEFKSSRASKELNSNVIQLYSNPSLTGSSLISTIVDMRKSLIAGNDISITSNDPATQKYLDEWLKEINFFLEVQKYSLNSELEGKVLTSINSYKKGDKIIISPVLMPDYLWNYEIESDDLLKPAKIKYTINQKENSIESDRFVYSRFNLFQTTDLKFSPSKTSYITKDCVEMEWACNIFNDLICKFKDPSYVFVTETWPDAMQAAETMKKAFPNGFEFGKGIAMKAKPELLQFPLDKADSLIKYIFERARRVSAKTGLPLYLIGFPDVVNYATSKDMLEALRISTSVERVIFSLHIKQVIDKSIELYNKLTFSNLVPNVDILIPPTSNMELENMLAIYKDLFDRKIISRQTLQELLPMIDQKIEAGRLIIEQGEDGQIISDSIQRGIEQVNRGSQNGNS